VLTNTVKAMSQKNFMNLIAGTQKSMKENSVSPEITIQDKNKHQKCFLGVDLGSAYTKFTVINEQQNIVYQTSIKTLNREKIAVKHVPAALKKEYPIEFSCATGYGRKHFPDADLTKTELNCAALGVGKLYPGEKNILDIGGEDIKVIKCTSDNTIENFYLNDKCAAGTGSFITEIAEKAGIRIEDMTDYQKELNSFCTVFAKTEIMSWLFEGLPVEDIAKGIYHSIINRVVKLRMDKQLPVYIIGGVIAHHPYLCELLNKKNGVNAVVVERPQHIVSFGAALYALQNYSKQKQEHLVDSEQ
jgi:predicted CoA-substrate-specific enzyme activase